MITRVWEMNTHSSSTLTSSKDPATLALDFFDHLQALNYIKAYPGTAGSPRSSSGASEHTLPPHCLILPELLPQEPFSAWSFFLLATVALLCSSPCSKAPPPYFLPCANLLSFKCHFFHQLWALNSRVPDFIILWIVQNW